jgi:ABC-type uncharacterized transport system auxiliary subunit
MQSVSPLAVASVLACALLLTGCVARAKYKPYDYFSWSHQEAIQYARWEHDTHREHVDFTVRSDTEMYAYWKWRHSPDQHRRTIGAIPWAQSTSKPS